MPPSKSANKTFGETLSIWVQIAAIIAAGVWVRIPAKPATHSGFILPPEIP